MTESPPLCKTELGKTDNLNPINGQAVMAASPQPGSLVWERDGVDWPNRETSQFVQAGGIRWHVQIAGQGPVLLLLHGTGASNHSWRKLLLPLAEHFTVLAPDLPGHGFTQAPPRHMLSLPGMAALLSELLGSLHYQPAVVAGHSAGAAIAVKMCLDGNITPGSLVSINGALLPLSGLPGRLFSPLARLLVHQKFWANMFAGQAAKSRMVEHLLTKTGSVIEPEGVRLYARLLSSSGHTAAALGMMANWDLSALLRDLPTLKPRLMLLVGENDHMVPPHQARLVRSRLPSAQIRSLPACGHLLHEEIPLETVALILLFTRGNGGSAQP